MMASSITFKKVYMRFGNEETVYATWTSKVPQSYQLYFRPIETLHKLQDHLYNKAGKRAEKAIKILCFIQLVGTKRD